MQEQLTQREQEIFDALIAGKTPKEIAFDLNITYDTVKFHQKKIYQKLGVKSVHELFAKYLPGNNSVPSWVRRKLPPLKVLIPVAAVFLVVASVLLLNTVKTSLAQQPLPTDFVLTLNKNLPYGTDYRFAPDVFRYKGVWHPSPFKLGRGNRLVENEIYQVTCFFTPHVDISYLSVAFFDTTIAEDDFNTQLSGGQQLGGGFKAGTKYSLSTKLLVTKTASGASPAENQFRLMSGNFVDKTTVTFHKFEVAKLPYIHQSTAAREPVDLDIPSSALPTPNPLVITFTPHYGGDGGWEKHFYPNEFMHMGDWTVSPFKLGQGNRIFEDDVFLVNLSFTSNVDVDLLQIVLLDTARAEDRYWTPLSSYLDIKKNVKAGVRYTVTTKLLATKTASGTAPAENQFRLSTGARATGRPILTFTKFEVVKIN